MAKKEVWTATGRRKRSVAQVRMTAGKGKKLTEKNIIIIVVM